MESKRGWKMFNRNSLLTSSVLFGLLVSSGASANLVVFEPDDFAVGTYVSTISPLVSLRTFRSHDDTRHVPVFAPVLIGDCLSPHGECSSTTGTKVFRDGFGGIDQWGGFGTGIQGGVRCFRSLGLNVWDPACSGNSLDGDFNLMLMTFTTATDFVQISSAYSSEDEALMYGFDQAFNLVGSMTVTFHDRQCSITEYCSSSVSLLSQSANIRYALVGGWSNGSSLDNLQFSVPNSKSVPEPEALALLAAAAGCMLVFGRRRRISAP
jgi:hypothetical protein